jgi:hypothetical protein
MWRCRQQHGLLPLIVPPGTLAVEHGAQAIKSLIRIWPASGRLWPTATKTWLFPCSSSSSQPTDPTLHHRDRGGKQGPPRPIGPTVGQSIQWRGWKLQVLTLFVLKLRSLRRNRAQLSYKEHDIPRNTRTVRRIAADSLFIAIATQVCLPSQSRYGRITYKAGGSGSRPA